MPNLNTEISRLTNKDVKIRRRAVRALFDEDDPSALRGFVKLLDDPDFWFRNKALDAHRKWAKSAEELEPLMANNKRLVAEMLEKIPDPDIATKLLSEDDHVVRCFAAKTLADSESLHKNFASDEHHSVRIIAAENSSDEKLISSLLNDKHSAVRKAAISTASEKEMKLDEELLKKALKSSDSSLRSLIGSMSVKLGGEILDIASKDSDPKVRKSIADALRQQVETVDSRIESVAKNSPEIILRWLRTRYDSDSSSLRWSMIEDDSINQRIRSKLIEQMDGRTDIDLDRLAKIAQDGSDLVSMTAKNLEKSIEELGGLDLDSGITFSVDATKGASRRLTVGIDISGPFTENILELRFPRWVPGSYFIREPIQHMSELSAKIDGEFSKITRIDVDGAKLSGVQGAKSVSISYKLLAAEMTCRANHLDSTHVHIMPPYTWMLPTRGIDKNRIEMNHKVVLAAPDEWHTATQLKGLEGEWIAEGRDEFLDAIMESNANPMITFEVEGTKQHLKLWDSGGLPIPQEGLDRFLDAMKLVIEEHFALFGVPEWKDYWTVLHLTESGRGGLEHLRSQTSMMPRKSLQEGNEEQWRDLVSLFSHEFLHQWNVKQLRPKNFLDYELQKEVHSDLLWWFEGLTSWLGDILCLRSGAWTEEDWRKDWTRKMKRHTDRNGMEFESLQESSHDAWIHLYRPNSYSREVQISYYLEGEMAIFCLDAELRKRSKGEYGMDDVMATLYHNHKLDSNNPGITHSDIKKALVNTPGGRRLGVMLDSLVGERNAPDVHSALKLLGLELVSEKKTKGGWLGLNLANSPNCVKVRTHLSGSPCREKIHTGDEIIAVNGHRVRSSAELSAAVYGKIGVDTTLTISREGAIKEVSITPVANPKHLVNLEGKGNKLWDAIKATKR